VGRRTLVGGARARTLERTSSSAPCPRLRSCLTRSGRSRSRHRSSASGTSAWYLKVCPGGDEDEYEGKVGVFLHVEDEATPSAKFTMRLLKSDGTVFRYGRLHPQVQGGLRTRGGQLLRPAHLRHRGRPLSPLQRTAALGAQDAHCERLRPAVFFGDPLGRHLRPRHDAHRSPPLHYRHARTDVGRAVR
jgi:hypothetical protein